MRVGEKNRLEVLRLTDPGAYLGDKVGNEVLLPTKYIPYGLSVGDKIDVFVYRDSEDRIISTTLEPHAVINEFAFLKVKDVTKFGAFLDWGIEKDLLVPFREQTNRMEKGQSYLVYLYLDEKTDRLVATQKIQSHFDKYTDDYEEEQEVDLLIGETTDLGTNVIVDNRCRGLLFHSENYADLIIGDRVKGYIKNVREDGKLDVSLRKRGMENLEDGASHILRELKANEGFLPLHDKSDPEDIQMELQMSKKNFKRSVGILYKKKLITLEKEGIRLIDEN